MPDIQPGDTHRAELIKGLRELADFIEAHPDLPVYTAEAHESLRGDDAAKIAEVNRIASVLETPLDTSSAPTHFYATRRFSGGVTYRATAITQAEMDAWRAHMKHYDGPSRQRDSDSGGEVAP